MRWRWHPCWRGSRPSMALWRRFCYLLDVRISHPWTAIRNVNKPPLALSTFPAALYIIVEKYILFSNTAVVGARLEISLMTKLQRTNMRTVSGSFYSSPPKPSRLSARIHISRLALSKFPPGLRRFLYRLLSPFCFRIRAFWDISVVWFLGIYVCLFAAYTYFSIC